MSYPPNLSPREEKLWSLAMRWPVPAGVRWPTPEGPNKYASMKDSVREAVSVEETIAHGSAMFSDGLAHTLYYHYNIVPHLIELDKKLFPQWYAEKEDRKE